MPYVGLNSKSKMNNTTVYKYRLPPLNDWISMLLPVGAEPLCIQTQGDLSCMWAKVDPGAPNTTYRFRIAGTGHDLDEDVGQYIGSFQMHGGALVFHVFAEAK